MDRIRRNERLAAMTRILVESPNKIFTLGTFCEMFGAAKSTLSEDIDILRGVFAQFHLGQLDTVTGAAGGVRYRPVLAPEDAYRTVKDLAQMLAAPGRVLPGGFIYMADILAMPDVVERMGTIIASQFYRAEPDFVLTMETKGIPVAMMTARALGVPTVIVRRDSKVYEGPAVNINYLSGSGSRVETMSLSRRAGEGRPAGADCGRLHARGRHGARHGGHDARVFSDGRRRMRADFHTGACKEAAGRREEPAGHRRGGREHGQREHPPGELALSGCGEEQGIREGTMRALPSNSRQEPEVPAPPAFRFAACREAGREIQGTERTPAVRDAVSEVPGSWWGSGQSPDVSLKKRTIGFSDGSAPYVALPHKAVLGNGGTMYIVVGLGDPGNEYARTRHNVGFDVIDVIGEKQNIRLTKNAMHGLIGEGFAGGEKLVLVKPQTFMNLSGQCVTELVSWYEPEMDHLMVVYDDIDLPLGKLRMRERAARARITACARLLAFWADRISRVCASAWAKNRKAGNWPTGCSAIIRPRKTAKRSLTRFCASWRRCGRRLGEERTGKRHAHGERAGVHFLPSLRRHLPRRGRRE